MRKEASFIAALFLGVGLFPPCCRPLLRRLELDGV